MGPRPGAVPSGAFLPGSAGSSPPAPASQRTASASVPTRGGRRPRPAEAPTTSVSAAPCRSTSSRSPRPPLYRPVRSCPPATATRTSRRRATISTSRSQPPRRRVVTPGSASASSVQVLTVTTTADIADLVPFTGSDDLTIKATTRQDVENSANAGSASSSGAAVSPAVSLTISNVTTRAYVGTGTGAVATGAVTVEGNFTGKSTVAADAEAGGSDVSVGAAIAINVVITDTTARTLRNISGDDGVAVRITWIALTAASAEAGAKGASESAKTATATPTPTDKPRTRSTATRTPTARRPCRVRRRVRARPTPRRRARAVTRARARGLRHRSPSTG